MGHAPALSTVRGQAAARCHDDGAQVGGERLVEAGADLSECGRYRYRLWRLGLIPRNDLTCTFVMLNPSTADAVEDDPTIRKCIGFCRRWGYGRLFVVNLFAYRSTDPTQLRDVQATGGDPVGPDNDWFLSSEIAAARRVVLAWGSHAEVRTLIDRRKFAMRDHLQGYPKKTVTLGFAKDGNPRHPLMLGYATALVATPE